jgi:hypothetical protein
MDDLAAAHRLFDIELQDAALHTDKMASLAERAEWLQWAARNSRQLAILYHPLWRSSGVLKSPEAHQLCWFAPSLRASSCLRPDQRCDFW